LSFLDDVTLGSWTRLRPRDKRDPAENSQRRSRIIPLSATALPARDRAPHRADRQSSHERHRVFRSVNAYGLFAVMTTTRSEIVLEGS
jgi:hypothetical protein